jgi:hypothetical protein
MDYLKILKQLRAEHERVCGTIAEVESALEALSGTSAANRRVPHTCRQKAPVRQLPAASLKGRSAIR